MLSTMVLQIESAALAVAADESPKYPGFGALVLGADGYLWGTAAEGGVFGFGCIYKVKADGSAWTSVLSFTGKSPPNKGFTPKAGLINGANDFLWGTTTSDTVAPALETVFHVNSKTGALTTVADFPRNLDAKKSSGFVPNAVLLDDGNDYFWGTTIGGGSKGFGTIYKISAKTGGLITIIEFSDKEVPKGNLPQGSLINDGHGFLWGTTAFGGKSDLGTIFKIQADSGVLTTQIEFDNKEIMGGNPFAGLLSDDKGFLWGTTMFGGDKGLGTVFKLDPKSGTLTTVITFDNRDKRKGMQPQAQLCQDGKGTLWGTTAEGGENNCGTVFKINRESGLLSTVIHFTGVKSTSRGRSPRAPLMVDAKGDLWGTTAKGGDKDYGTVFRISAETGAFTTVVEFGKANPQ